MNANQSLLDSLCRIRELLCIAGSQGEVYTKVLGQAAVQPPVGLFLAKKYLASEGFTFRHQGTGNIMDIKTLTLPKLTGDVLCFCPAALCSAAFHCDSHDDVIEETNPARLILKYIADAGEHGMTSVELSKINGVRNVHSWVDKLVQCGTVVKRSVMPVPNAPVKQRANASCMLLHLTQYAMPYQPDADGLQILPGDDIRDDIYRYLVELLDRHQLRYIPTIDLASYLNINKRHMQYLRNQALMLGRQNDCILHFSEEWCCPLKFNFEPGVRRLAWCMSKSLPSSTKDNDIPKRAWNFPLYEQIDYFLRRKGYLTSAEIRKLTALSRKRAPKVMDLFQQSGYESIKIQDGKQIINKLLPKPGSEFGEVKEYDMEDVVHGCETFEMPVDSLVRQSSAESSSADVLHVEVPTSSSNKRKSIEMTPNSASKKSKGSIDQQERRNIVIEYLQEQPTKVGSLLEVSQKIRTYFRDQDRKFYTDKKTITRCLKGLQDDGLIDIEETNLDESQSENFGGNIKKVELIILKTKDNETKEERNHRIEEYVNSYVHIKTVYKRREMIELKDEGEEDEEDEHSVHELPADVVMDAEEPLEEFQFTTNAAVLEIVEEKPVIKRNRRKSKIVVEEQDATVTPAAAEVAVVPEEQQAGEDFSDMIVMLPRKSNSVDRRKSSGDDTWTVEEVRI